MRKFVNKQGIAFLAEFLDLENLERIYKFIHLFDYRAIVIYEGIDVIMIRQKKSDKTKTKTKTLCLSKDKEAKKIWICWDPINKEICWRYDKFIRENCEEILL